MNLIIGIDKLATMMARLPDANGKPVGYRLRVPYCEGYGHPDFEVWNFRDDGKEEHVWVYSDCVANKEISL